MALTGELKVGQIFRIGTVRYAEGLWRMRKHGPVIAHCTDSEDFPLRCKNGLHPNTIKCRIKVGVTLPHSVTVWVARASAAQPLPTPLKMIHVGRQCAWISVTSLTSL